MCICKNLIPQYELPTNKVLTKILYLGLVDWHKPVSVQLQVCVETVWDSLWRQHIYTVEIRTGLGQSNKTLSNLVHNVMF